MQMIELHILRSLPVSCVNRDDLGSPKSATFGGATRARISSQSLKRAAREFCKSLFPGDGRFAGVRTKLLIEPLAAALAKHGVADAQKATALATAIADAIAQIDSKNPGQVSTLAFLCPSEIDGIAAAVAPHADKLEIAPPQADGDGGGKKPAKKAKNAPLNKIIVSACKSVALSDGADIALFGRMMASLPDLTVEASTLYGHALSTHAVTNESDFFTAMDDRRSGVEDQGAGMLGNNEFNSAVFYQYIGLNLGMLADERHLAKLTQEERRAVVDAFIRASLRSLPGARATTMNAHTAPVFVLGTAKLSGHPLQLVNAFETPIPSKPGIVAASISAMEAHFTDLKQTWGERYAAEVRLPGTNIDAFCSELTQHVI